VSAKEFNRKTFAPLGGPFQIVEMHGEDQSLLGKRRRVNVERLMRSNCRSEPELTEVERAAAGTEGTTGSQVEDDLASGGLTFTGGAVQGGNDLGGARPAGGEEGWASDDFASHRTSGQCGSGGSQFFASL
jgi:hypothetical protein